MDDVGIWSRTLTEGEIRRIYGSGLGGRNLAHSQFESVDDIGAVATEATFVEASDGSYIVEASGSDIWGVADECAFANTTAPMKDFEVIAKVDSVENTNSWAKSGVMIRDSLNAGAKEVAVAVRPDKQIFMQWRTSTNGGSAWVGTLSGGTSDVKWVKLVRRGDIFYGYYSIDGENWILIDDVSVSMVDYPYGGLCVTSNNDGTLCTAEFSDVVIRP